MSQSSTLISTITGALRTLQRASLTLFGGSVLHAGRLGHSSQLWSEALLGRCHARPLFSAASALQPHALSPPPPSPRAQPPRRAPEVSGPTHEAAALQAARRISSNSTALHIGYQLSGRGSSSNNGGSGSSGGSRGGDGGPQGRRANGHREEDLEPVVSLDIMDNQGWYLTTLRFYCLPSLQKPRSDSEQRCLQAALAVVAKLRSHGYTGMFAGGWVRDQFLGRPSQDIDIVTNASITEMLDVFGARCRFKGGNTCDVAWEGQSFEVTSYRGGLRDGYPRAQAQVAEFRDAATRDFTLNALFFEPDFGEGPAFSPPAAASAASTASAASSAAATAHTSPRDAAHNNRAAHTDGSSRPSIATDTAAATAAAAHGAAQGGDQSGRHQQQPPEPQAPASGGPSHQAFLQASNRRLQPVGLVKDYVGGVGDLRAGLLRVYPDYKARLGLDRSSVKEDPIRVLRAARLSEELGLRLDDRTLEEVKGAAGLCHLGTNGVSYNRVYRELAKMADLDCAARDAPAGGPGGAKARERGSPRFTAALERCRSWGVLKALFPDLPQDNLDRVIREVMPRLPAYLPLELKLSCLVSAQTGEGDFVPQSDPEAYQPVRHLLDNARPGQAHWPHLLASLTALVVSVDDIFDLDRKHHERLAEILATEGSDKAVQAFRAFIWRDASAQQAFSDAIKNHRRQLKPLIEKARARRAGAGGRGER